LAIIPALRSAGYTVAAHDPKVAPKDYPAGALACATAYEAAAGADMLVILTEWDEYRRLDLRRLHRVMRGRLVFDCRNLLNPEAATAQGFTYRSIGRGAPAPRARPGGQQRRAGYARDARLAAASPA
jgi:UDPglucose 6-dehydrogenase